MRNNAIQDFTNYFQSCCKEDQQDIIDTLLDLMGQIQITEINKLHEKKRKTQGIDCPHCQGPIVVANGHNNGSQQYYCKVCGKYFRETTGTPLAWLKKKDKWGSYIRCMLLGYSLRKCAKEVGISLQTSFDWRHKILTALNSVSAWEFKGICESDDIFLRESEKGNKHLDRKPRRRGGKASKAGISNEQVAVIVSCDRQGNKDLQVAAKGRISKKDIERVLGDKMTKNVELCTDSHHSYTAFAKSKKIRHHKINASSGQYVKDQVYHVQNVNNTAKRLKQWMDSFNGVSTKYLQNYLNWFMMLERIKGSTQKLAQLAFVAISSNQAWFEYKELVMNHALFRT